MKKAFLLLTVLLMFGSSVFAIGGIDLSVGPKVGYQTAKLSYQKDDIKAGFANSFVVGLFGRVEFQGLYVQPEVLWFKSSNAFDMQIDKSHAEALGYEYPNGVQFTMTRNAMNIQVPVMVGYKYDVMDLLALRAQVGPTANFVIPGKTLVQKSAAMEGAEFPAQLEDAEFDTKSIAWGVQFGVGADVLGFTLDINYNLGVSKIFGANLLNNLDSQWVNAVDLNNIDQTKQNLFMVTIGYKFL
ncbi:MAG: PorT family protein [Bacteroidales bacterium]|nr:PorT family protein [Bacteroidales bacterium]